MKVSLALDSGAHSLYMQHASPKARKNNRGNPDFFDSLDFGAYVADYIYFAQEHKHLMDFCVTVDVIFNPEYTWDIYKEIKAAGLNVMPVWHPGESLEWLKKHASESAYVGFGGIGQEWTRQQYIYWARKGFAYLNGSKDVRVHGFAMTSFPLLREFPWHSVDSTTAFTLGRYGSVLIPSLSGRQQVSFGKPVIVSITERKKNERVHYEYLAADEKKYISKYLEDRFGLTVKQVSESLMLRELVNLYWMNTYSVASENFTFYASGKIINGVRADTLPMLTACTKAGIKHFSYLGTFFLKSYFRAIMDGKKEFDNGIRM